MKRRATSPGAALRAACVAAAIAVGLPFASAAEQSALQRWLAGEVGLAAGFDYSEGDYGKGGGTKTKMLFLPFTLTYLFDDFALTPTPRDQVELRVIVPFISVDGGIAAIDSGEQDKGDGLGDIIVAASYLYYPRRKVLPMVELGFRVKTPTASKSDGLGTGETDYTIEGMAFQRIGRFMPFAALGYRFIGKDDDFDLRNGMLASGGIGWLPSPRFNVGVSYDWRQAISKGGIKDAHELTVYGSVALSKYVRFSPYGVAGLSRGSPDYAVGAQIKFNMPIRPRLRDRSD